MVCFVLLVSCAQNKKFLEDTFGREMARREEKGEFVS